MTVKIKQQQNWYDHIMRMQVDRLPKILLTYRPKGIKDEGKQQTRWENSFDVRTSQ